MLKLLRQILALVFFAGITLLFLDFTGMAQAWAGWMSRIQLLPAVMALNVLAIVIVVAITIVFGRVYCSVICPLGVLQDLIARVGKWRRRYRYSWSPARSVARYSLLALTTVAAILGINIIVALVAPYSSYGRMVSSFLSPLWIKGNNMLASHAASQGSTHFYHVDQHATAWVTVIAAGVLLVVLAVLAYRNGRTWCNTVCPVGTALGLLSRHSILKPIIDTSKCNACGLCSRNCKSSCINSKEHKIDYSRCVGCMDCLSTCNKGAISYTWQRPQTTKPDDTNNVPNSKTCPDKPRRAFMGTMSVMGITLAIKAAKNEAATLGLNGAESKESSNITPPGSHGIKNLERHCTACQLCVTACPNRVLEPSSSLGNFMQPHSVYTRGYCRPGCTRCSHVCPTGAIEPIDAAQKSAISIGRAVWMPDTCLRVNGINCHACERHCPTHAITLTMPQGSNYKLTVPAVDTTRCTGCGACQYYCPAQPHKAINVKGYRQHREI